MKGSASDRSRAVAAGIASAYLLLHLPFLAPSLEDIDSINFALGVRDFDVADHRPHPPGYPIYIALGRLSRTVLAATAPSLPDVRIEALALASWSAIAGALALVAAWKLFECLRDRPVPWGLWAVLVLAVTPAFWMTGLRPMSDMPGLAAALVAQGLLLRGIHDRRSLVAGGLVAGLAAGVRSQTMLLTLPLFIVALAMQRGAGVRWLLTRPVAAFAAAACAWVIPLLADSGGLGGYLRAFGAQADEVAAVEALILHPTPRRVMFAVYETFVLPFGSLPLAAAVLGLAAVGTLVMAMRERLALGLLALAFAPYAMFHMLLQETVTVRYALPIVPAIVWLAVRGAACLGRPGHAVAAVLVGASAAVSVPAGVAYGREAHPAFRAIDDISRDVERGSGPARLFSHYSLRRPLQASPPAGIHVVEPRRNYEWMDLVDYWLEGGREPVSFLADPKRTDLALIDTKDLREDARSSIGEYRWSVADRPELSGVRPIGVDWYRFDRPPGWFAAEGWALTPETGGLARATTMGVDHAPIDAYVRRRPGPMRIVVGVRHLGSAGDPPAIFDLAIDGVEIDQWTLDPAKGANDLRFIDLSSGLPPGGDDFAHLSISARSAMPGRPTPEVAVRQFDIQLAETLVYGFGEGWHEAEYDTSTGRRWRWTSERSVLRVAPFVGVRLRIRGESPLKYVEAPPRVRVTAAGRDVAELRPDGDFEWAVTVPADVVAAAGGAIAIEVDTVYLPGPAEGTEDPRRLGLRLFDVRVDAVTP